MNKILKGVLISLGAVAALALLCVGLYSIGYLDMFIFFILPGALILGGVSCLIWNIVKMVELKKQGKPIPQAKKAVVIVCSVVLGTVLLSLVALFIVFAMAIAYM